jgi:hypothetical protein
MKKTAVFIVTLTLALTSTAWSQSDTLSRRVRFARGRTTSVLKGTVVNDGMNQYVLTAKAGQRMSVHLTSPSKRAKFDLYSQENRALFIDSGGEDTTDWEGELPESGEYVISVYSTRKNTKYTLEITIR